MQSQRIFLCLMSLLVVVTGSTGCGRTKTACHASVMGTVTWNGKPVEEGSIVFVLPSQNKDVHEARVSTAIKAGSYSLTADQGPLVGTNKVQIVAIRKTGKTVEVNRRPTDTEGEVSGTRPSPRKVEIVEQYLPKQFNGSSSLKAEVRAGENEFNFQLTGKAVANQILPD